MGYELNMYVLYGGLEECRGAPDRQEFKSRSQILRTIYYSSSIFSGMLALNATIPLHTASGAKFVLRDLYPILDFRSTRSNLNRERDIYPSTP
jgi:hypothetical protein